MYTSLASAAFSALLAGAQTRNGPSWQKDYPAACKQGQRERKPLAVFIGWGKDGYDQVAAGGKLTPEMKERLARSYVCVYVDASKETGQGLAGKFQLQRGLVLSDRTGTRQAFRHEGALPAHDLNHYLKKYSNPFLVVKSTEIHAEVPVSYQDAQPAPVEIEIAASSGSLPTEGFGGTVCRT